VLTYHSFFSSVQGTKRIFFNLFFFVQQRNFFFFLKKKLKHKDEGLPCRRKSHVNDLKFMNRVL
jgi:hypothetical protein